MTNSLSQDIYAVGQLMADNLNTQGVSDADVEDGLTTLAGKILDVSTSKVGTSLTIDIDSLNLEYGDSFNITGTLTDENDNAISGASVKLLVGSTVTATQTTDSNGGVTFTHAPVSVGTHTFKLVYEGDTTYDDCTSSTVTKSVEKETTYLNLTSPSTNVTIYTDGSVSIAGTLMDNDSTPQPVTGKSIVISESGTTITTLTTDSNGAFTGTISGSILGIGSHTLLFAFVEETNYKGSSVSKTVTVQSPSLALATDKSIISYADSESATLTATYTGANVVGKTVSFDVVSGGVVVENIGTATTDNNGQCSVSYYSKGTGAVSFVASVGSILSGSYTINDAIYYDGALSDKHSSWDVTDSSDSISYDSTNKYYTFIKTRTGDSFIKLTDSIIPPNVKIEYDILLVSGYTNNQPRIGLLNPSTTAFVEGRITQVSNEKAISWVWATDTNWSSYDISTTTNLNILRDTWYHIELTFDGSDLTMKLYNGDTLLGTNTASVSGYLAQNNKLLIDSALDSNTTWHLKNLTVTPL